MSAASRRVAVLMKRTRQATRRAHRDHLLNASCEVVRAVAWWSCEPKYEAGLLLACGKQQLRRQHQHEAAGKADEQPGVRVASSAFCQDAPCNPPFSATLIPV